MQLWEARFYLRRSALPFFFGFKKMSEEKKDTRPFSIEFSSGITYGLNMAEDILKKTITTYGVSEPAAVIAQALKTIRNCAFLLKENKGGD